MILGAAYYPEHRDPGKWAYDLDRMVEANLDAIRVGEFAWKRFEPRDGEYDFAWLDRFNALAAERDIGILLCPPLRTLPAWLMAQDPELAIERADGVRLEYGSRYSFCINHPLLLEKGKALAAAMASRYGHDKNIIGWHLDNEHGDEPDCHCAGCRRQFQQWCEERYGDIASLNTAWGTVFWGLEFDDFAQVPTPRVTKAFHGPGHLLAWRRFRSDSTIRTVARQAQAVRQHAGRHQFITTNNQNWNPRTDYPVMAEHLDITGTNYYPGYGDGQRFTAHALAMCRSYKHQTFQVHELRNGPHMIPGEPRNSPAPGEVERLAAHCVANGADATFFFRWRACPFGCEQSHGTITDYDGRPKRVHAEVARLGARMRAVKPWLDGTVVRSEVAVMLDFPSRWVLETGVRWNGPKQLYAERFRMLYDAVRELGVSCDVVSARDEYDRYKILIVPLLPMIDDALAARLTAFVQTGGCLLWHPLSGIKDQESRILIDRLHPQLAELLGVDIPEFVTAAKDEAIPFVWQGKGYEGKLFADLTDLTAARAVGTFSNTWYADSPAVTERRLGKGRAFYVMTFPEQPFYRDFLAQLCAESGVPRILDAEIPADIEIAERQGDGHRLIFLLNSRAAERRIVLPRGFTEIYADEGDIDTVTLPPFGVRVLLEKRN